MPSRTPGAPNTCTSLSFPAHHVANVRAQVSLDTGGLRVPPSDPQTKARGWSSDQLEDMDSKEHRDPPGTETEKPRASQPPSPPRSLTVGWMLPHPGIQHVPPTEDWVCDPPEGGRRPQRHWSLSIEDRRQLAMRGCREHLGGPSLYLDMAQLVAQLASEVVDKDVLFRRSPASPEVASTLWDFLDHCTHFWQNTMAKEATGSPPR
ncbi:testis-expressed protein 22 isoform X2 [Erinaceus europaeus]|uniref:Testis-expressed protein 22 isoform X2 n=1 Tax=Erinaceus europaeus TaxID=9365 RepID=A0ABM3WKS4_ERIEU|nr:testis-expressed protein 22 isoform X2 [Erinaceus europaeus]